MGPTENKISLSHNFFHRSSTFSICFRSNTDVLLDIYCRSDSFILTTWTLFMWNCETKVDEGHSKHLCISTLKFPAFNLDWDKKQQEPHSRTWVCIPIPFPRCRNCSRLIAVKDHISAHGLERQSLKILMQWKRFGSHMKLSSIYGASPMPKINKLRAEIQAQIK